MEGLSNTLGLPRRGEIRTVYLDQFVYVRLAKAGFGKGTVDDVALRERLLSRDIAECVGFRCPTCTTSKPGVKETPVVG
jgi:hypothetical protein